MNPQKQSWLVWLIPVTLSIGLVAGTLIRIAFALGFIAIGGPDRDMAGAAAALMIVIWVLVSFPASMFTLVISRIMQRPVPRNLNTRLALSLLGGGIIGGLVATIPAEHFIIAWVILVFGSALVTWFSVT